jgi:hypothetical protein
MENALRTREFIPAGAKFSATLWLEDEKLDEALRLACRLTDALGARRRRGDGRIEAELTPEESAPKPEESALETGTRLKLLLRARDPVCLPVTGHPGNLIQSERYLRGQVLRGALIAWLLRRGATRAAKGLFASSVRAVNAYPLPDIETDATDAWLNWEVLPMPLHFGFPKPQGGGADGWPWWAAEETPPAPIDRFARQQGEGEKLKRPADGAFLFKERADAPWRYFNASLAQRLRNSPASDALPDGALFV